MATTPGSSPVTQPRNYFQYNRSGGISTFNGQNMMMRDSHLASSYYGFDGNSFTNIPKHDCLYYVRVVKGANSSPVGSTPPINGLQGNISTGTNNDWQSGFGFLAKKVNRPQAIFSTEVVNQYNKQRVIQTKHRFGELSIDFYDTTDNQILKLFLEYYQFYYGDSHNDSSSAWANDIVSGNFNKGADDWGFQLNGNSANNSYFIERIEIYQIFAGRYTRVDIVHPKITSMGPSPLSFESKSSAVIEMRFAFEGMAYVAENEAISSNPGLMADMRLQDASYYEPERDTSNIPLSLATTTALSNMRTGSTASNLYDSAIISGIKVSGSSPVGNKPASELENISGLSGAYATEGSYAKTFNALNQVRADTMTSHNTGDLLANLGFNFLNTGKISNQYFRYSNPTIRNTTLFGKYL